MPIRKPEKTRKAVTAPSTMTPHEGKRMPVESHVVVTVRFRDGTEWTGVAGGCHWMHRKKGSPDHKRDVVAYRVSGL